MTPEYYKCLQENKVAPVGELMDIIALWADKTDSESTLSALHVFYVCNVLKYLWRHPFKGTMLQDLCKAEHYMQMLIKEVEMRKDMEEK